MTSDDDAVEEKIEAQVTCVIKEVVGSRIPARGGEYTVLTKIKNTREI
jgi:hypothetical protein